MSTKDEDVAACKMEVAGENGILELVLVLVEHLVDDTVSKLVVLTPYV